MKIHFATGNENKLKEFRKFLNPTGIEVEHIDINYPEIRSDDIQEIARAGAEYVSGKTRKTVIVEDSGLFIDSLNSFPGTYTKWVHEKIGHTGLFRLLEGKGRKAEFRTCIGLSKPGHEPVTFLGTAKGAVTIKERGTKGWGHDPIFIPDGYGKTWAEDPDMKAKTSHRTDALKKFTKWLKENKQYLEE
ncbi:MAG: RdgB/HAM1 family non-canonical purine NTP pyrophosphatase [archaeon]|nr:RdgB/HAM1 family non-canonical purine NTP pyrophosphatase [archaeon]